ncbi:hypothetical protein ACFQZX_02665 [Mucilaginibacter litoreus]|uniref:Uncharacterized protein n=1 Tax=Mucilaginibacter litoreus TaxID=1048221 RepID=A0ABW3ANS1_9SPHI
MKYVAFLIVSFIFIPVFTYCQGKAAINKVASLPEVKEFMQQAVKSHPKMMIAREPDKDFHYYWVKVGLGNLDMFRTNYDFYVDLKTNNVFYTDFYTESVEQKLTLSQWRRWRVLPGWQKLHCYHRDKKRLSFQACKL